MARLNNHYDHLRYDIAHGFIELVPGDRTQPFVSRAGFYSNDKIKLLVKNNPKRPGSKAHEVFALYQNYMTVDDFLRANGRVKFINAFEERPGRAGPTTSSSTGPPPRLRPAQLLGQAGSADNWRPRYRPRWSRCHKRG